MKIRRKPSKPKRTSTRRYVDLWNCRTLAELLAHITVAPEEVYIADNYDGFELYWNEPESDEDYAERIAQYGRKLAEYETWYEANKEVIEAELQRREDVKQAEIQKRVEELEKRKQKLLKELER